MELPLSAPSATSSPAPPDHDEFPGLTMAEYVRLPCGRLLEPKTFVHGEFLNGKWGDTPEVQAFLVLQLPPVRSKHKWARSEKNSRFVSDASCDPSRSAVRSSQGCRPGFVSGGRRAPDTVSIRS